LPPSSTAPKAAKLPPLLRELKRIVGKSNVFTAPADLALYAYDSSLECHLPEVVVFPHSTEQVAAVVAAANRFAVPFTPRGAGTNLSGGSVPVRGGIVVALSRLNRLLQVDEVSRCAVVQPCMTNLALQEVLTPLGWVFHPDPASQKVSTIGGNVAENAGGPHCLKYGVTTNHVLGVTVVLPNGRIVALGGAALDPPGYDLVGLINGSEGTLGIVTEIVVRISRPPEEVCTLLAVFDSMEAASEAVSAIIAAGIIPAALEIIDRVMIGAIQASMDAGYPEDAEAVLVVEVDGLREAVAQEAQRCDAICRAQGAREVRSAQAERERERLWAGRRGAFGAAARLASEFLVNDGTVPRTRLPEVLRQTQEIAARYGLRVGNNFHAGDGNLHPLILLDGYDPAQRELAKRAAAEMVAACIAAGGAISGEHGIGLEKRGYMPLLYSPADLAAHAAVKRSFDPLGLCNPGKILPDRLPEPPPPGPVILPSGSAARTMKAPVVDGMSPAGVLAPESEQEVAAMLAGAAQEGVAIIPFGSGTKLDLGMPPRRFDYAMSLARLNGIVEHDAGDLTVTVRAGTRLADLQTELAQRGQWLPLDPPHEDATIGGIIATNSYGPGRMRYGACRDLILGLRVALPSGEVITVGGKTVKNVSGYDLPKLFIGSLGTLGVITAATFRLLPTPQRTHWSACAFANLEAAMESAQRLASSRLVLSAIEVLSGEIIGRSAEWITLCRAQGVPAAVERQMQALAQAAAEAGGEAYDEPRHGWQRIASGDIRRGASAMCRISVPAASLLWGGTLADARLSLPGLGYCPVAVSPALCLIRVLFDAQGLGPAVSKVREHCVGRGGSLVIERAPVELKLAAGVWGAGHPGEDIMRALKAEFDPKGVLSPGRFVGGI
jgi:glycolate oxidase subunit GlcD